MRYGQDKFKVSYRFFQKIEDLLLQARDWLLISHLHCGVEAIWYLNEFNEKLHIFVQPSYARASPSYVIWRVVLNEMTLTNVLFICWTRGLVNPWCSLQNSSPRAVRADSDILQRLHRLRTPCQHFHSYSVPHCCTKASQSVGWAIIHQHQHLLRLFWGKENV